jgi:hypothetical protein
LLLPPPLLSSLAAWLMARLGRLGQAWARHHARRSGAGRGVCTADSEQRHMGGAEGDETGPPRPSRGARRRGGGRGDAEEAHVGVAVRRVGLGRRHLGPAQPVRLQQLEEHPVCRPPAGGGGAARVRIGCRKKGAAAAAAAAAVMAAAAEDRVCALVCVCTRATCATCARAHARHARGRGETQTQTERRVRATVHTHTHATPRQHRRVRVGRRGETPAALKHSRHTGPPAACPQRPAPRPSAFAAAHAPLRILSRIHPGLSARHRLTRPTHTGPYPSSRRA